MHARLRSLCHSHLAFPVAVVVAGVVFLPCFYRVERHPRPWVIRLLQGLAALSALLAVGVVVWMVLDGVWVREAVTGLVVLVFLLGSAALAFLRAAAHGEDIAWLRPSGDPTTHWLHVLRDAPHWYLRSRAARELHAVADQPEVATALRHALDTESNRHVLQALRDGLAVPTPQPPAPRLQGG